MEYPPNHELIEFECQGVNATCKVISGSHEEVTGIKEKDRVALCSLLFVYLLNNSSQARIATCHCIAVTGIQWRVIKERSVTTPVVVDIRSL